MKKPLLIFLSVIIMVLSFTSCGLTITRIDNSTINEEEITEEFTTLSEAQFGRQSIPSAEELISSTDSAFENTTEKETMQFTTAPNIVTTALSTTVNTQTVISPKENVQKKNTTQTESKTVREKKTVKKSLSKSQATTIENTTKKASSQVNASPKSNTTASSVTANHQTTKAAVPSTEKKKICCTISISCKTILDNMTDLEPAKKDYVPENGEILNTVTVYVDEGSSAYDVLKTVCNANKIHLEYRFTPAYNSYYIEGIHQLYEFDCGDNSGWMYSVNDVFPNKGCNMYEVKNGDEIKFQYTCDLGSDIGADI